MKDVQYHMVCQNRKYTDGNLAVSETRGQKAEKGHISSQVHHDLVQSLYGMKFFLESAIHQLDQEDNEQVSAQLRQIVCMMKCTIQKGNEITEKLAKPPLSVV